MGWKTGGKRPRTLPTCQQRLACDLRKHALIYGGFALRELAAPPSQFTREPLRASEISLSPLSSVFILTTPRCGVLYISSWGSARF